MLNDTLSSHYKMVGPTGKEPKPSHRKALTGKINGKVTRVRTGCLTCRGRRKKCDERKPGCRNCEKAGYQCQGYPEKIRFKEGRTIGGTGFTPVPQSKDVLEPVSMTSGSASKGNENEGSSSYEMWSTPNITLPQQIPSVASTSGASYPDPTSVEDGLEDMYTPLIHSQLGQQFQMEPGLAFSTGRHGNPAQKLMLMGSMSFVPQNMGTPGYSTQLSMSPVPARSLPYPVPNIFTPYEKEFFYHFTNVLSPLLTTSNSNSSAINTAVIPLAMKDRTMMKTLLSLAGSHLLKHPNANSKKEAERNRLHASAVSSQNLRREKLLEWNSSDPVTRPAYSLEDQEILLGTSIFLCVNELVVGSRDKSLQDHLDMARNVITSLSPSTNDIQPQEAVERVFTEVNPLLLEFFIYHDSLAAVTIPSVQVKPQYVSKDATPEQNQISLIGHEIMPFINRIAPLRSEPRIGIAMSKAASIWYDLDRWKPPQSYSPDQQRISEFWKWALLTWLYSILHPEGKADPQIQDQLSSMTAGMQDINDSVKACLLFPLFIVGGAAISEKDKESVRGLFQMLMKWSSLGNIEVSLQVVENMWRDYDLGLPRAWDWITQLEKLGMTLLVT